MSLETYGRYQLIRRLASGGMAEIFLARELGAANERPLVVKRILPHLAENADFVQMFLNEARIAVHLDHPNVVQLFDLGEAGGSYYIAMEYIHGEDIRRVWRRAEAQQRVVPIALVCRIVLDACKALHYAHQCNDATGRPLGIVHRDVSPQNILLTFEGGVKLVDFGIAKAALQSASTRSGVLKGKYSYMSPEQAQGKRLDRRSDIFALGIILYELVTGTRLFKKHNDIQTLNAVIDCNVSPPSAANPKLPSDLDAIVLKALAKEPERRFQEAGDFQRALEGWLKAHKLTEDADKEQLAAFMQELYADRLSQEEAEGRLVFEDPDSIPRVGRQGGLKAHIRSMLPSDPPPLPPPPATPPAREPTAETFDQSARRSAVATAPEEQAVSLHGSHIETAASVIRPVRDTAEDLVAPLPARPPPPPDPSRSQLAGGSPYLRWGALAIVVFSLVTAALMFVFQPKPLALVIIASEPSGASVLFDDRVRLVTPARLPPVPPGTYRIRVSAPGYEEQTGLIHILDTGLIRPPPVRLLPRARPEQGRP